MVRRVGKHRTVRVSVGEMEADIDEEIVPLVRELWRAGIETVNSCQENRPGIIWIQFATTDDAANFLDIVAEYEEGEDTLYNRAMGRWDGGEFPASDWDYAALPEDRGLVEGFTEDDEVEEWHEGLTDAFFSVSVRFPRSDFPAVLARMARYNRRCEQPGHAPGEAHAGQGDGATGAAVPAAPA